MSRTALLTAPDGRQVAFTNWSFGQLAALIGAPASYLRKLPAPPARVNLEWGIEGSDAGREQAKLLYQPPTESVSDGQVRAFNQDNRWHVPLKAYGGQNSRARHHPLRVRPRRVRLSRG